jgi:hypothetical protein
MEDGAELAYYIVMNGKTLKQVRSKIQTLYNDVKLKKIEYISSSLRF